MSAPYYAWPEEDDDDFRAQDSQGAPYYSQAESSNAGAMRGQTNQQALSPPSHPHLSTPVVPRDPPIDPVLLSLPNTSFFPLSAPSSTPGTVQAPVPALGQATTQPQGQDQTPSAIEYYGNRAFGLPAIMPPTNTNPSGSRTYGTVARNYNTPNLEAPGLACSDPECTCGSAQWPIQGHLNVPSCAMLCEVCGLFRRDFGTSASNLRRHVREHHQLPPRQPGDPTVRPPQPSERRANGEWLPARLYESVIPARR